jgi:L-lactate dehydrogenase (cytochrome)
VLPHKSYVYASGSANTGASLKGNLDDWSRITFRPRVMRNVGDVDTERKIFGHSSLYPFYISPMGTMGALHPEAEPEMIRGAVRKGAHVVVSAASTKPSDQIMQSYVDEQERLKNGSPTRLFYQYYMPVNRNKAIELMHLAKKAGYNGLWITVDTPVLGKRTADRYLQAEEAIAVGLMEETTAEWETGSDNEFGPAMGGRPVQGQMSPHTTWEDLKWIRDEWSGPIILKGIQCAEDAKLAMEYGCDGILLSNHGGRQLHTAPSALMTLLEIRTYCPEVLGKLEIFLDGGLRDGTDVLKALCLGATAVGVGRPFLYALAAYGAKGVERCVDGMSKSPNFCTMATCSAGGGVTDWHAATGNHLPGSVSARNGQREPIAERDVAARTHPSTGQAVDSSCLQYSEAFRFILHQINQIGEMAELVMAPG